MDSDILLAKIVANPTETTWAQVYSTLNLYVVLSIKTEETETAGEEANEKEDQEAKKDEKLIASSGKELLERIQREYFSLDDKSLENIKKSIEAATADAGDLKNVSIVLANITSNVLYLIVVSAGRVVLRRNGKVATVASGTPGEIEAYSGKIQADDVVILETEGFAEKITVDKLSQSLDQAEVSEISESLTPLVHADPAGSEAAIILQYKKTASASTVAASQSVAADSEAGDQKTEESEIAEKIEVKSNIAEHNEDLSWEEDAEKHDSSEADDPISHLADQEIESKKPKFSLPFILKGDKKVIIGIVIVVLAILLVGSIFYEKNRKETAAQNQILREVLTPAEQKFAEAEALVTLNKGLALDEFADIKAGLSDALSKLPEGSTARKKLDEFVAKVDKKISELSAGSTLNNQKVVFDKSVNFVSFRDDLLTTVASNGSMYIILDSEVSNEKSSGNKSVTALTSLGNFIYTAGSDGIAKAPKGGGTAESVVENPGTIASLDTFGTNLYALNTSDKTVDKYPTGSFTKSSYFTEDVTLNNPTSMSIDSSIWIMDGSKVRKFTRGKEESFSINGLTKNIGSNALITTGVDYENIYILDPSNNRILSVSKSGEIDNQYVSKDLTSATSIAVDEPNKKAYVVISGKLNSFDL